MNFKSKLKIREKGMLRASIMMERTNIPITYSILHDTEYRNLIQIIKKKGKLKRKAFTETNHRIHPKLNECIFYPCFTE
jgi:hypothetical protein